jgi:hypothetical protein
LTRLRTCAQRIEIATSSLPQCCRMEQSVSRSKEAAGVGMAGCRWARGEVWVKASKSAEEGLQYPQPRVTPYLDYAAVDWPLMRLIVCSDEPWSKDFSHSTQRVLHHRHPTSTAFNNSRRVASAEHGGASGDSTHLEHRLTRLNLMGLPTGGCRVQPILGLRPRPATLPTRALKHSRKDSPAIAALHCFVT